MNITFTCQVFRTPYSTEVGLGLILIILYGFYFGLVLRNVLVRYCKYINVPAYGAQRKSDSRSLSR